MESLGPLSDIKETRCWQPWFFPNHIRLETDCHLSIKHKTELILIKHLTLDIVRPGKMAFVSLKAMLLQTNHSTSALLKPQDPEPILIVDVGSMIYYVTEECLGWCD